MEREEGGPGLDQRPLVTYAVLTGLTPLIPIPFLDDAAKAYFRKRLVQALAAARGVPLSPAAMEALSREPEGCLLTGCLVQVLLYVPRKLLSKLFFFLEWKRALDLTSQTYQFGFLVDCALQEGYLDPAGGRPVEAVREAIRQVCRELPGRPIEGAVGAAFRQSRSLLTAAVGTLDRTLRRLAGRRDPAAVEGALGAADEEERREVAGVAAAVQRQLQAVPESYFQRLREALRARLG